MERGRPVGSMIRQNIVDLLFLLKKGYGYEIYSLYRDFFPPATMRVIYYHLKKGEQTGEIKTHKIVNEKGDYSWGQSAQKIYYSLGKNAVPKANKKLQQFLRKKKKI